MNRDILIGTSGYNYKDWRDKFYPQGLAQKNWLSFYAQHFPTLEVNATFYRSFEKRIFERWRSQTPDNFQFTLKGPRFITHLKKLSGVEESLELFLDNASGLEKKLTCMLWQFTKRFDASPENFEKFSHFCSLLPKNIFQAFEFRHESWFADPVYALLEKTNATLVLNDAANMPLITSVHGKFAYIRFHGPGALYASSYSDEQLGVWAERITKFSKRMPVYCYFNNDLSGYAIANARTLERLLKAE